MLKVSQHEGIKPGIAPGHCECPSCIVKQDRSPFLPEVSQAPGKLPEVSQAPGKTEKIKTSLLK